jgi:radical SAM protein with 4Fe4S-binding SPASM domain
MLNISTLLQTRKSRSDGLRYGAASSRGVRYSKASSRPPVVVWNATLACNLGCLHCYASAKTRPASDELTTADALSFVHQLAALRCPALLLSGGEPLLRNDLFEIVAAARNAGLSVTLSTNGTLVDRALAARLRDVGVTYVGISIDGDERTHDGLRRCKGSWQQATAALYELGRVGVTRGVRFTLTPATSGALGDVLRLVADLGVERFCMYHLVPSGRGVRLHDVTPRQRYQALLQVFEFAASHPEVEVLTVANPSDGVILLRWIQKNFPDRAERAWKLMTWNGGARWASGSSLACVDHTGTVYPDQFSRHRPLGNIRRASFADIWSSRPPLPSPPKECHRCEYFAICGGGMRARAELATGDPSGMDPSCLRPFSREVA